MEIYSFELQLLQTHTEDKPQITDNFGWSWSFLKTTLSWVAGSLKFGHKNVTYLLTLLAS